MLSDTDIRERKHKKEITIEPFEENSLTPVGYDLRIGSKAFSWKRLQTVEVGSRSPLKIEPNDTVVIETYELIQLSKKIGGTVHAMATHTLRRGLSHVSTTVDPGWTGKLLISIHNYRATAIELDFKETLCTICFYQVQSEAQKDVGRPPGRSDIWAELLDKAREERSRLEAEKRQEQEKTKKIEIRHKLLLTLLFLVILGSGFYGYYFLEPANGAILMAGLTAAVVLLPEIFKAK